MVAQKGAAKLGLTDNLLEYYKRLEVGQEIIRDPFYVEQMRASGKFPDYVCGSSSVVELSAVQGQIYPFLLPEDEDGLLLNYNIIKILNVRGVGIRQYEVELDNGETLWLDDFHVSDDLIEKWCQEKRREKTRSSDAFFRVENARQAMTVVLLSCPECPQLGNQFKGQRGLDQHKRYMH